MDVQGEPEVWLELGVNDHLRGVRVQADSDALQRVQCHFQPQFLLCFILLLQNEDVLLSQRQEPCILKEVH